VRCFRACLASRLAPFLILPPPRGFYADQLPASFHSVGNHTWKSGGPPSPLARAPLPPSSLAPLPAWKARGLFRDLQCCWHTPTPFHETRARTHTNTHTHTQTHADITHAHTHAHDCAPRTVSVHTPGAAELKYTVWCSGERELYNRSADAYELDNAIHTTDPRRVDRRGARARACRHRHRRCGAAPPGSAARGGPEAMAASELGTGARCKSLHIRHTSCEPSIPASAPAPNSACRLLPQTLARAQA
jgi:hypothetical protein